jgi:SAM-dependent methyltransferase
MSEAKPAGDNTAQIEFWNGRVGETWARYQDRLDRAFAPMTDLLAEMTPLRSGERVVDVGCGCGDLALTLAVRIGRAGNVLGVDISKPMLAVAQVRGVALTGDHAPVEWLQADASQYAFTASYDLLVSRFGVMFFAEPVAALRNLGTALKPGGRFAFLCWRELEHNPWAAFPASQIRDIAPPQAADPHAPGPFAFADKARVGGLLREAGFDEISAVEVETSILLGSATGADAPARAVENALDLSLRTGPVGAVMREADDALKQEVRRRLSAAFAPLVKDGEVRLPGALWLYSGRKPAT